MDEHARLHDTEPSDDQAAPGGARETIGEWWAFGQVHAVPAKEWVAHPMFLRGAVYPEMTCLVGRHLFKAVLQIFSNLFWGLLAVRGELVFS